MFTSAFQKKSTHGHPLIKYKCFEDPAMVEANSPGAPKAGHLAVAAQVQVYKDSGKNLDDLIYRMTSGEHGSPIKDYVLSEHTPPKPATQIRQGRKKNEQPSVANRWPQVESA